MKQLSRLTLVLAGLTMAGALAAAPALAAGEDDKIKPETCYSCHDTVQKLHKSGAHVGVACGACHSGLAAHVKDQTPAGRPKTNLSYEACGACHPNQHQSFTETSYLRPARDEKSQLTNRAPNPFWDQLMAGHGFTKEHALTRSHTWMLVDHFVVDRAYGGRFQPKDGWQYVVQPGGRNAWDYLVDTHPESAEQNTFIPQSAKAANPVCLQCKSQDQILDWAYMGDPDKGAKWSRASNVVELAKSLQHGLNCFTCHDPHAAKPRIVRDGLIEALTRPEADTLWHKDPSRTGITVVDMGVRGFPRKIALLDKYDSRLQCGQCHVEYNCNPGTDPKTGDKVTMADRRTNHFPYKDVFGLYEHYTKQVSFLDFKHTDTGGQLWKGQHPEAETFYNSKHAKAGVQCGDCHMQKRKDAKSGKAYTSHFVVTPKAMLKDTCLSCHDGWSEEQARYAIDSVKAYIRGKLRKAEFWLAKLIDRIGEAKKAGVSEEVLGKARDQHLRAHILWEYWTAENSDGFHNPEMARESLTRSVDEATKGIALLDEAMTKK